MIVIVFPSYSFSESLHAAHLAMLADRIYIGERSLFANEQVKTPVNITQMSTFVPDWMTLSDL